LIILRDGDPGEPETLLVAACLITGSTARWSKLSFKKAIKPRAISRIGRLVSRKISLAIAGDRTLGGLCDRITPQAPDSNVLAVEGSPQIKGAIIPIELIYVTADPLG
jgi:hypothetical protein